MCESPVIVVCYDGFRVLNCGWLKVARVRYAHKNMHERTIFCAKLMLREN